MSMNVMICDDSITEKIKRCTQCGKKFTPKLRPFTTYNLNIYGGADYLCKQCVSKNERTAKKAIEEALASRGKR